MTLDPPIGITEAAIAHPGDLVILEVADDVPDDTLYSFTDQLGQLGEATGIYFVVLRGGVRVARIEGAPAESEEEPDA